jgi:hypothetical protein
MQIKYFVTHSRSNKQTSSNWEFIVDGDFGTTNKKIATNIALYHHEKSYGSGYPEEFKKINLNTENYL